MRDRSLLPFATGLILGVIIGVLIPDQIRYLASGALGYLLFIVALAAVGFVIVAGQDAVETLYHWVGGRFGRRPRGAEERHKDEDRPPVNPWGWPNP